MSRKRQTVIFNHQGRRAAQLTSLSYDFADGEAVPAHYHKQDQLVFASRGVMTIRTDHGIWVVPPLRAVWIPGHQVHSIATSGAVLMRTLYFAPKLITAAPRRCLVLNVTPLFRELILHACSRSAWRRRVAAERRIIEVLIDQIKAARAVPLQLPRPRDPRALRIAEALLADPSDARPLAALCRAAGGSKRTIERVFLEDTGMTFGKWRQQLRLIHGLRLLAAGEKVTSAALDSGYRSPSAFIAAFRRVLGQTPHQYLA